MILVWFHTRLYTFRNSEVTDRKLPELNKQQSWFLNLTSDKLRPSYASKSILLGATEVLNSAPYSSQTVKSLDRGARDLLLVLLRVNNMLQAPPAWVSAVIGLSSSPRPCTHCSNSAYDGKKQHALRQCASIPSSDYHRTWPFLIFLLLLLRDILFDRLCEKWVCAFDWFQTGRQICGRLAVLLDFLPKFMRVWPLWKRLTALSVQLCGSTFMKYGAL